MCEKTKYILFKEPLWKSILSDIVTYGGLLACLYVSEETGSTFFTVLCAGVFFILMIPLGKDQKKFRSKEKLQEWLSNT